MKFKKFKLKKIKRKEMTILELFYTNTSTLKEYIDTLPGGLISTCHLNVQEKQQVNKRSRLFIYQDTSYM